MVDWLHAPFCDRCGHLASLHGRGGGCDPQPFYRRAAKLHHPDQGGDPAIFATLQRAWEALA